ncbi:hypothetical protein WAK64_14950 [Bacillus spongiae]|uniref:Uncharacterized protein n=1 Tax=Bacillus spongiae TaxID=2683610 RepID=A0ABU8HGQ8_9BACI
MVNSTDSTSVINTNATSSAFGWDFQSNAAILLALKNIKNLDSLKVEGNIDDIELYLKDNKRIFAQAKSQEDPTPSTNTLTKLRDALKTLINAINQSDYEKIIYISNIMNPLKNNDLNYYWGQYFTIYSYTELNDQARTIIDHYIKSVVENYQLNISNLDYNKLEISVFPFFGQDDETRYRIIFEAVKKFLVTAKISAPDGVAQDVMNYWQSIFFQNAATRHVELKKEELVWPIVVLDSSNSYYNDFFDDYDLGEIDEINRKYSTFIDKKTEQFEFVTKVINDFNDFRNANRKLKGKQAFEEFVELKWKFYDSIIINELVEPEIKEGVAKLVIIKILKNRFTINSVKEAAGL